MKDRVLVSVITPAFNDAKFIRETIKSVLNQTFQNFELIIVDDCSNDNTIEIINSFSDSRIKLFRNDVTRGAAYCRNLAIQNAKGDYVAFLDADDLWLEDKLEKQLKFMQDNNYDFSYTNYIRMDENGNKDSFYITGPTSITHKDFIKSDYIGCLTAMYKRSVYPELKIGDGIKKRNDYALWLLLSQRTGCYLLNENLSYYRLKKTGISKGSKVKLISHHTLVFREVLHYSLIHSYFCALRNVLYYFVRRIKYKRKIK